MFYEVLNDFVWLHKGTEGIIYDLIPILKTSTFWITPAPQFPEIGGRIFIPVNVTLDISESPIDFQWGSWKYPG